jgi:hypothetical protein
MTPMLTFPPAEQAGVTRLTAVIPKCYACKEYCPSILPLCGTGLFAASRTTIVKKLKRQKDAQIAVIGLTRRLDSCSQLGLIDVE